MPATEIAIEKITTREEWQRLEPAWNPLLHDSAADRVTLTWEWLTTWWQVFGAGREPFILVARDGPEVVGIAPLLRRTVRRFGLAYRRLEFLASGEDEADEICSEGLDFILRRGREADALKAIIGYLSARPSQWDEMLLCDVPEDAPSISLLREMCAAHGVEWRIVQREFSVHLPLPCDWETFLKGLNPNIRRDIRKDRRLAGAGDIQWRAIDDTANFEEGFETLARLHRARWEARGRPGVFASEKFTRFHRLVAPRLLPKGWLRLFVLSLNGEPVAALHVLTYNRVMSWYQSGFDGGHSAVASPGTLALSFAIESAIAEGFTEFDFLKAEAGSYKLRWSRQTRGIVRLRLARRGPKETLYSTATKLANKLQSIRRTLRRNVQ